MMPKCDTCGRFHTAQDGSAWKMVYSGSPPEPYGEITRCFSCVLKHGPFTPQNGIKPEHSCGLFGWSNQTITTSLKEEAQ